jgi:hypothetical protein
MTPSRRTSRVFTSSVTRRPLFAQTWSSYSVRDASPATLRAIICCAVWNCSGATRSRTLRRTTSSFE